MRVKTNEQGDRVFASYDNYANVDIDKEYQDPDLLASQADAMHADEEDRIMQEEY